MESSIDHKSVEESSGYSFGHEYGGYGGTEYGYGYGAGDGGLDVRYKSGKGNYD